MPWATVAQNVFLPFRLEGKSYDAIKDDILAALKLVGLDKFQNAYPRELSGGMKMRVSIARAMVTQPKLILMDEPFAALDEITRFKLNNDLLEMQARIGCTVIFVTHSVFESVFLSDRIVVMAARPGLVGDDREQLVGLKPVGNIKQLTAGAHLFEAEAEAIRLNSQGYTTSVGFSPTLGSYLGLGFLRNGRARHGETVRMVDHLRKIETLCEVCDPVFFDPDGGRVRG